MQGPRTAHPFIHSTLLNLQSTEVVDRYTVRFRLHRPSAAFPSLVVYYPCSLIAPESITRWQPCPIGCGPFRLVRWERDQITEVKRVVFYSRGETARGFYASISPWYAIGTRPWPAYDPERARFLLRQAKSVGVTVVLQSLRTTPYMQQTAALIQGMWSDVGFKVVHKMYDASVLTQKRRARAFHAESTAASYRFDPDGWFSRHLLWTVFLLGFSPASSNANPGCIKKTNTAQKSRTILSIA